MAMSGSAAQRIGAAQSPSGKAVRENAILKCDDAEKGGRVGRDACRKVGPRSMVVPSFARASSRL
jgi:hypothetical protein